MNRFSISVALSFAAAMPFTLHAADVPESANRFSLGARFGMNFKAAFHNSGAANPGPAIGGIDHNYDDGYVRVDSSGNAGGVTWNWGYQNAAQVVGDTIQFHANRSGIPSDPANHKITDDPQYGAELTYQRIIGPFLSSGRWGLEAAFGWTDLDLRDNRSGFGLTDTYQLNGILPPLPGYSGTFAGPGAVIGDTPTRTVTPLNSRQKLSGQMFSLRVGPFAEWYILPQLSVSGSIGMSLVPACVDYDFSETMLLPTGATAVTSGRSSRSQLLYGPYASALVRYECGNGWGIYAGAQFQRLNNLDQSVGTRTARLDQSATLYGVVGLSWRF
jgi:hypothetical protein